MMKSHYCAFEKGARSGAMGTWRATRNLLQTFPFIFQCYREPAEEARIKHNTVSTEKIL